MTILNRTNSLRTFLSIGLVVILLAGLSTVGHSQTGSRILSEAEAAGVVGGLQPGACGILVGIGVGIVALSMSTFTLGLGGAFAISVGAHVAALACVS